MEVGMKLLKKWRNNMILTEKQIREKIDTLIDDKAFEDACFLIVEGLSLLHEQGVTESEFDDLGEVVDLMLLD